MTADGPAMKSGRAPLGKFKPWPKNPRTHPEEEIVLLAEILKLRGFDQAIVVDEDWWILKGHGRLKAAYKAGLKDAPYVQRFGLSDADKDAMRVEDNQIALLAGWDNALLRTVTTSLQAKGYDMKLLAFDQATLGWMTSGGRIVESSAGEWGGMPTFSHEDKTAFRSIVVHFKDQKSVDDFAALIEQKIGEKIRYLWFPRMEIETLADKRYSAGANGGGAKPAAVPDLRRVKGKVGDAAHE